jgi:CMP-N,N'-diacetyllegionaminic acid synthase
MKIKSIILARGGSKGVPKKNIIDINGKPLIYYSIKASIDSIVDETWVSTDCQEIKSVSLSFNAKVLDRPMNLSDDFASSESALLHFAENVDFDYLVFIQPTSPMILSDDINGGIELMKHNDSVFSAYTQHWIPYWDKDSNPIGWTPINRPRRQDVEEKFVENGTFYITKRKSLLESKSRMSGKIGIYQMPFYRSFQIDTFEDLEFIKKIMISL